MFGGNVVEFFAARTNEPDECGQPAVRHGACKVFSITPEVANLVLTWPVQITPWGPTTARDYTLVVSVVRAVSEREPTTVYAVLPVVGIHHHQVPLKVAIVSAVIHLDSIRRVPKVPESVIP